MGDLTPQLIDTDIWTDAMVEALVEIRRAAGLSEQLTEVDTALAP